MIAFQCPGCGKTLNSPNESAGLKAKCKGCGLVSIVPFAVIQNLPEPKPSLPILEHPEKFARITKFEQVQEDQLDTLTYLREEVRQQRVEAQKENSSGGEIRALGMISICCAPLAIATICIPFAPILLAGFGMIMGGIGLLLSVLNGGRNIALPLIGLGINVAPFVILFTAVGLLIGIGSSAGKAFDDVNKSKASVQIKEFEKAKLPDLAEDMKLPNTDQPAIAPEPRKEPAKAKKPKTTPNQRQFFGEQSKAKEKAMRDAQIQAAKEEAEARRANIAADKAAKKKAAEDARPPALTNEEKAESRLKMARQLRESNVTSGNYRLETLIKDFPGTKAAETAQRILDGKEK